MKNLMVIVALLVSAITNAAPVTWTLNNYVFDDGGTASGSFVMDSVSKEITAANIVTSSGSAFAGESYDATVAEYDGIVGRDSFPGFVQFFSDNLPGRTNETVFVLTIHTGFDFSGGTYLTGAGEFRCNAEIYCATDNVILREAPALEGFITSVPVPAAVWLFGSALAGLGWMRRKQVA
jgi:hypothetical protein